MVGTAAAFDLQGYLERERSAVEESLARALDRFLTDAPASVAGPIRYAAAGGGKRLRPILCVEGFRTVVRAGGGRARGAGASREGLYLLATALEVVHCYSLAHDDLPCMDDDDLRRGRPATHRRFGASRTAVAGAAMIPLACRMALEGAEELGAAPSVRTGMVAELCRAAGGGGMVGGQLLDLEAEGRELGIDALEEIHLAKTGALLTAALRIGAAAAGASPPQVRALEGYGRHIGLAFQIADDMLDVTADPEVIGKPAGSDSALAKSTFPSLLGLEGSRARAHAEVEAAAAHLREAALDSPVLVALARYAAERDR